MTRKFALLIGNSQYQDPILAKLKAPNSDVAAFTQILEDPAIGAFDQVTPVLGEVSSAARRAIGDFFAEKKKDDLLLLYFSGHGVLDENGLLYLAVKDTQHNRLSATGIPASFIKDEMENCRSKRQILILDCCHSGAFARGKGAIGLHAITRATFEGSGGYGQVVLTATDATQYAWEGDQVIGDVETSLFTHFMIEGLHTGQADSDRDGRITLDELYDYVYEQVRAHTPHQTPRKWEQAREGEELIIAHSRYRPTDLPSGLRQAIESTSPHIRVGAVGELGQLLRGSDKSLMRLARGILRTLAKEDDSQRVQKAASAVLTSYDEKKTAKSTPRQDHPIRSPENTQPSKPLAPRPKEVSKPIVRKKPKRDRSVWVRIGTGVLISIIASLIVNFATKLTFSPTDTSTATFTAPVTGTLASPQTDTSQPTTTIPTLVTGAPTQPAPTIVSPTGTMTPTITPSPSNTPTYTLTLTPVPPTFTPFGTGADGNLIITNGQTIYIDNIRSAVSETAFSGQPNIVLSDANDFAANQEVLIIQMQGTGAGSYEFGRIASKTSNTLTLQNKLVNQYTVVGGNSKAQIVQVPNYGNVTVQAGGILTAHDWDGNTGGIVVFRALTSTSIEGAIQVNGGNGFGTNTTGEGGGNGGGFRGGGAYRRGPGMSFSGEGTGGSSTQSNSANGNGAGGGYQNLGNVGGSGGGNRYQGLPGTKEHNEFIVGAVGFSSGSDSLVTMTLGGGGSGGSAENNNSDQIFGGGGGAGGGIIFISSRSFTVTGGLSVNGGNGGNGTGASGGGGAGGSIYLNAETATLGSSLITALGGNGGTTGQGGQGGNGGLGRIYIQYTTFSGTTNPSASSQQVNYFNLTGTSSNTLYVPDVIGAGNHLRYVLLYGQRGVNTKTYQSLPLILGTSTIHADVDSGSQDLPPPEPHA